jgi:hypothetical protein
VEAINNKDLVVSPIVELELTYLHEIGRLTVNGPTIFGDLVGELVCHSLNKQQRQWCRQPGRFPGPAIPSIVLSLGMPSQRTPH